MPSDSKKIAAIVERITDYIDGQTKPCNAAEYDDVLAEVIDLVEMKRRAATDD